HRPARLTGRSPRLNAQLLLLPPTQRIAAAQFSAAAATIRTESRPFLHNNRFSGRESALFYGTPVALTATFPTASDQTAGAVSQTRTGTVLLLLGLAALWIVCW